MARDIRTSLLVGVSFVALTVAMPDLGQAADLPTKAPIYHPGLAPAPPVTWWIEGGLEWTGGGEIGAFDPGLGIGSGPFVGGIKPRSGFSIAGGFDYRFAGTPWHVSADVRYGKSRSRSQSFSASYYSGPFFASTTGSATHKEDHWVADFMVGRDIGLGTQSQIKLGVRVADLSATTDATVNGYATGIFVPFFASFAGTFRQSSRFLGVGPRAAIGGTAQIQGPWSIDYDVGVAALYGNRKLNLSGTIFGSILGGPPFTTVVDVSNDSTGWVPNANGSLALGYTFAPNFKVSAGYQIDYYWGALRTGDGTGTGNVKNIDRSYSGPFARLSGSF